MAFARESSGRCPDRLIELAGLHFAVPLLAAALLFGCGGTSTKKLQLGDPCQPTKPSACSTNMCVPLDVQGGFCTKDCSQDGLCPTGFNCVDAGKYGMVCERFTACTTDDACPSGNHCDTASGNCYIKVSRQLCSPCTTDLQCPTGGGCFTVPASGETYCTTACGESDSCPAGFTCTEVSFFTSGSGSSSRKQCVPANPAGTCEAGKSICAPCKGDNECGGFSDLCVRNVISGEQFCGVVCDPSADPSSCPKSFHCEDLSGVGSGPYQCVPNSGTCKEYCDSSDEHVQAEECGLGRQCDVAEQLCQAATDGRECAPCQTDDDCRSGSNPTNECVVNNTQGSGSQGETFCAEPCPCDQPGCSDGSTQCQAHFGLGFDCVQVGSGAFCVPQRGTCLSGLGRLGDSCTANGAGDCLTGLCLSYGNNALCSATCAKDVDCGDTHYRCCGLSSGFYDCSQAGRDAADDGPTSGAGVCALNGGLFGDDCRPGRPPCQSGTCLDIGTAQLCTQPCAADGTCPTDFTCRNAYLEGDTTAPAVPICFPAGGGAPGSDCTFGPAACSSSLCIKKDSGPICTEVCDPTAADACPSDWTCTADITPVGQSATVDVCLPSGVTVPTTQSQ